VGRPDRTTITIGILAAVALLGLGLIFLLKLLGPSGESTTVEIPELRGQEVAAAERALTDLGLDTDQETVADEEITAGLVVGTDPAPTSSRRVRRDDPRVGGRRRPMPRLTATPVPGGRTHDGPRARVITLEQSPVIPADGDGPDPARCDGERGAEVDMVISAGADAWGTRRRRQSEPDAIFQLTSRIPSAQIIERRPSAEVTEGFVITTGLQPASRPQTGPSQAVSRAVPSVVPNVIGMTEEEATTKLEEFGFVVMVGDPAEVPPDDPNVGKVAAQDPPAGSTQDFGSQVTIQLGEVTGKVTVPDVIGKSETNARNTSNRQASPSSGAPTSP
jgi:beta-lactam-binding protein with PASTA domain